VNQCIIGVGFVEWNDKCDPLFLSDMHKCNWWKGFVLFPKFNIIVTPVFSMKVSIRTLYGMKGTNSQLFSVSIVELYAWIEFIRFKHKKLKNLVWITTRWILFSVNFPRKMAEKSVNPLCGNFFHLKKFHQKL